MTQLSASASPHSSLLAGSVRLRALLETVPYSLLALPLRFAVAAVFWSSGTTRLASRDTTLQLFADEYKVRCYHPSLLPTWQHPSSLQRPFCWHSDFSRVRPHSFSSA
jgi:putative oxidoreductase